MTTPLTPLEIYAAALEDMKLAEEGATAAIEAGSVPPSSHDEVVAQMLRNRLQDRIDRGQLPHPPPIEKVS